MAIDKVVSASITDSSVTSAKVASGVLQPNFRNIIINGDMNIAQRATSQASITSNGYYTLDRFRTAINNGGTWTQSQSTTVPSGQGFATSLKMDCTTADTSLSSGDFLHVQIPIEAQYLQYLKYGTSSAETLTLSFWVRSNKTGTYCICLQKSDNTRYDFVAEYSISSADTWEKKTITIAPDSNIQDSGGAIDNDNGEGLKLKFTLLSSGRTGTNNTWNSSTPADCTSNQVNLADSTSNEWYLTGVQLEVGTAASDFEFLPTDINLERCQRYYYFMIGGGTYSIGRGGYYSSSQVEVSVFFPCTMRDIPTLEIATGTDYYNFHRAGSNDAVDSLALNNAYTHGTSLYNNSQASGTAGHVAHATTNNASSKISFVSEL